MGCISSKAFCRSISIREELSHGFQSSASAWEELITSNGSKDQLFALLSSSKHRSSSFKLPSTVDLSSKNSPGLNPDVDGVSVPDHGGGEGEPDLRRSKSCQLARDNENKLDRRNDKNQIGSRSFHTVEEYDALLDRIHKLSRIKDEYSWEDVNSVDTSKDSPKNESGIRGGLDLENGWKRKAVAKGLKSLDVPSIEFPAVARLKQRVGVEGTTCYVTPKFGSYNVAPAQEKDSEESSRVFSPELVAAFEDCMQQLQVDEESILREIEMEMDGYSSVDAEMENEFEVEVL